MTEIKQSIEARQAILSSIHEHLAASERFDSHVAHSQTAEHRTSSNAAEHDCDQILIELFSQALGAVSGRCVIAHSEDQAALAIQRIIEATKPQRIAISDAPTVKRILGRVKSEAVFLD